MIAKDYADHHSRHNEVEFRYLEAEAAYRNSEVVKSYDKAKKDLEESLKVLKYLEEDLLLVTKQRPVFIDLGEMGVFIGADDRVVSAPIIDQR